MRGKQYVLGIWLAGMAALLAGCGGSSSSTSNTPPPTGLKKRVLISNQQRNTINVIDAQKDVFSSKIIGASSPGKMVTAGGQTIIVNEGLAEIFIFSNTTEAVTFQPLIADIVSDVAITPDGKTAWVAERNNGFVQAIDTATGNIVANIAIADVSRLAMSPNGTRLLCFTDTPITTPPQPNTNTFWVIDTIAVTTTPSKVASPITAPAPPAGSPLALDQPFTAVFNGSETQAFILNCGVACGGGSPGAPTVAASVVKADFSNVASPAFGAVAPVAAATVGLVKGSTLFVAGTPSSGATGTLQALDTNSLAVNPVITPITDGLHDKIVVTTNNRLYIAARNCTPGPISPSNQRAGCLSIVNVNNPLGAGGFPVTVPVESALRQNFDVTGIQPISGRSIVYVVQGGELDFFDVNADAVSTSITPLDVVGLAIDVVQIDP